MQGGPQSEIGLCMYISKIVYRSVLDWLLEEVVNARYYKILRLKSYVLLLNKYAVIVFTLYSYHFLTRQGKKPNNKNIEEIQQLLV